MTVGRAINGCLLILLLVGGAQFAYWGHLNWNGYCWAQHRTLSTEERFMALIGFENSQPNVNVTTLDNGTLATSNYPRIPYQDTQTFLKKNPHCCSIVSGLLPGTTARERFFGMAAEGVLSIQYNAHFKDEAGHDQVTLVSDIRELTNCGKVRQ